MAAVEVVLSAAVGIFLEEIEIGGVVFDAIAAEIPEDADARALHQQIESRENQH